MKIKSVVASIAMDKVKMSALNCDENGVQKCITNLNKDFISGNKLRFCILNTIKELNNEFNGTLVANSDGRSKNIAVDIASDLGGFMITGEKIYANKRVSPLYVGHAISKNASDSIANLWVKFKNNPLDASENDESKNRGQNINTKNYTYENSFMINTALICDQVSSFTFPIYENGEHINYNKFSVCSLEERKRRIKLYLHSLIELNGFANQARAAVDSTPSYVYFIFSEDFHGIKNKDEYSDKEWNDMISYFQSKGDVFIEGGANCDISVFEALTKALIFVDDNTISSEDNQILTFEEIEAIYSKFNVANDEMKEAKKLKKQLEAEQTNINNDNKD